MKISVIEFMQNVRVEGKVSAGMLSEKEPGVEYEINFSEERGLIIIKKKGSKLNEITIVPRENVKWFKTSETSEPTKSSSPSVQPSPKK